MSQVIDDVLEGLEPLPELVSVMAGSRRPVLLGVDIGTSGVRAALFDEQGAEVEGASVRIDRRSSWREGTDDFAAVEAEALLEDVAQTIDALFAKLNGSGYRVELIAISSFWHSLVGVDAKGCATTPVLGWADSRAVAATHQLRAELDETKVHARTGCRIHPSYWPAKLRRLQHDDPEVFRATTRWLSFADYLTLQFFGESATSVSMASGTGLLNQHTCEWDAEMLEASGIGIDSLPEISAPDKTFHELATAYAARWPALSTARLIPAIADGAANNIGAGCTSKEKLALMIGTSGALRVCYAGEPPQQLPGALWCYRVDRNRVLLGGALSDGGGLYKLIRDSLLGDEDIKTIESELELLKPDAHGLTMLPFWNGERSTGWNPAAHGSVVGLSAQTRGIEILRAAMEAVAYRFALIADALKPFAPAAKLFASGHALQSSGVWAQILADVLGRPIVVSELREASLRGAALLALEATGKIQSIEEVSAPVEIIYEPDMSHHAIYRDAVQRQQRLYEKMFADI